MSEQGKHRVATVILSGDVGEVRLTINYSKRLRLPNYLFNYYCGHCKKWIPRDGGDIRLGKNGRLYHAICSNPIKTKPNKKRCWQTWSQKQRQKYSLS
jgi:hypothetical protein